MKEPLPYFMQFGEDVSILPKEYLEDYAIREPNRWQIIMITNDKSTFSANNGRQKVQTLDSNGILQLKGKRRGIMVLDFLLPQFCLNLAFLLPEKEKKLAELGVPFEAATYFKYGKIEEGQQTSKCYV